jgi:hypothetical protein
MSKMDALRDAVTKMVGSGKLKPGKKTRMKSSSKKSDC